MRGCRRLLKAALTAACAMLAVALACNLAWSQGTATKKARVKKRLLEMFDLSRQQNWPRLAGYILYTGPDKARKYKDPLNPAAEAELKAARRVGAQIKAYLDQNDSYQFKKFVVERETEGEWCAWLVHFLSNGKKKRVIFAFLLIKGQYRLGDID